MKLEGRRVADLEEHANFLNSFNQFIMVLILEMDTLYISILVFECRT